MKTLFPYQKRAVAVLRSNPQGGALFMEPGLGKTITALEAWGGDVNGPLVVVCPISAIGVWHNELADMGYEVPYLPASGAAKARAIQGARIVVTNYESLLNPEVLRAMPVGGTVVFDESQRIKTPSAKRTKAAWALSQNNTTYILTGTPVTKTLMDLYAQYRAIDPGIWDRMSFTKFKQKYAIMGGYGGYHVVGYRNMDDLEKRIAPYTFALRKADALSLPPQTDQIVPIRAKPGEWKEYKTLANGGTWYGEPVENPLVRALRLQQMVGEMKVPYTVEVVKDLLDAGEKVVVFYRFLEEGSELATHLPSSHVHLHGKIPADLRRQQVETFQKDPKCTVFLAQIDSGAVAITLTASSNVVYHSMSWSYESAVQSRDRVHRVGQNRHTTYRYIHVVGPDGQQSIDGLIAKALDHKESVADMIMANDKILEVT